MKWQYHVMQITMSGRPGLPNTLAQMGQQQWELVSMISEQLDQAGQVLTLVFKKSA